jgi:hypothetical protein
MQTLRGSRNPAPVEEKSRRPSRPFLISVAVHVVLAIGMAHMLITPSAMSRLFGRAKSREVVAERIGFLRLPTTTGPAVEGKSGGDGRPLTDAPPARIAAPDQVPSSIPPLPATTEPAAESEGGSGPLVGGGGPTRGIRPTYTGPRVWAAPGDIVSAPKSAKERLDSAIVSIIAPFNDSLAVAAGGRKPSDWTFEKGGRKYGIDPQFIRLGKVSIPTAVLALLPINQQANPTTSDRNKLQNQLHADIFWQAQRGMNEADFKKAVKSIRERKERERAAQQAENKTRQEESPAAPTSNER